MNNMFWNHVVQARMRANRVVMPPPFIAHNLDLVHEEQSHAMLRDDAHTRHKLSATIIILVRRRTGIPSQSGGRRQTAGKRGQGNF